jgi:hypothetical protein
MSLIFLRAVPVKKKQKELTKSADNPLSECEIRNVMHCLATMGLDLVGWCLSLYRGKSSLLLSLNDIGWSVVHKTDGSFVKVALQLHYYCGVGNNQEPERRSSHLFALKSHIICCYDTSVYRNQFLWVFSATARAQWFKNFDLGIFFYEYRNDRSYKVLTAWFKTNVASQICCQKLNLLP